MRGGLGEVMLRINPDSKARKTSLFSKLHRTSLDSKVRRTSLDSRARRTSLDREGLKGSEADLQ